MQRQDNITIGPISRDDIIGLGDRMHAGDLAALNDFARFAFANPRDAADRLGSWFDQHVTHHEGSDDARALDDWVSTSDPDDLDWVAYMSRNQNLPPLLRLAMAAIVAGGRAMYDDIKNAA
jgi:hypothetical protein